MSGPYDAIEIVENDNVSVSSEHCCPVAFKPDDRHDLGSHKIWGKQRHMNEE